MCHVPHACPTSSPVTHAEPRCTCSARAFRLPRSRAHPRRTRRTQHAARSPQPAARHTIEPSLPCGMHVLAAPRAAVSRNHRPPISGPCYITRVVRCAAPRGATRRDSSRSDLAGRTAPPPVQGPMKQVSEPPCDGGAQTTDDRDSTAGDESEPVAGSCRPSSPPRAARDQTAWRVRERERGRKKETLTLASPEAQPPILQRSAAQGRPGL